MITLHRPNYNENRPHGGYAVVVYPHATVMCGAEMDAYSIHGERVRFLDQHAKRLDANRNLWVMEALGECGATLLSLAVVTNDETYTRLLAKRYANGHVYYDLNAGGKPVEATHG